ncbi:unnamed protein product [Cercopithifilaria johnstoni]|uniref:Uncharacterized protein n=1 Tax=Cercopithifilaria johnstoni TaxID=2874296 RepID=A0A8J2LZ52_9BILA|nr:unnamed protein product [Cercopithifilaria johnstoni]
MYARKRLGSKQSLNIITMLTYAQNIVSLPILGCYLSQCTNFHLFIFCPFNSIFVICYAGCSATAILLANQLARSEHVSLRKEYLPRSMGTTEVVIYKSNNSHFASRIRAMDSKTRFVKRPQEDNNHCKQKAHDDLITHVLTKLS